MDFLDPKKTFRHTIILISGYILIGIAIVIATIVLLYEAYGFGLGKGGSIIQNGLLFVSSQPHPASIYVNGKLNKSSTNTRLTLPEGIYSLKLTRTGYRTWSRSIEVDGGTVEDFDYPLLVPTKLVTTKIKTYSSLPGLVTQSLNRRYLVSELPGSDSEFDVFDLSNPTKAPTEISLPANILSKAKTTESWQLVGWSNDNQHVLLDHLFDGKSEYVMLDITDPTQSFNLTQTLSGLNYTAITLDNEKYDQYYLYDSTSQTLETVNLKTPNDPTPVLSGVIAYSTYLTNTVLYATSSGAAAGKVDIDERVGTQTYHVKTFDAGSTYLLDMASYNGVIYVAAGSAADNKVYIYKDPVSQLAADPDQAPVPSQVLFVTNPNYLSFSTTAQFIEAEGGQQFGVYDIENSHGYNYTTNLPLDDVGGHATWMDGDRLTYISGGHVVIFDYDHNYQQSLEPSVSGFTAFFDPNYDYVYAIAPEGASFSLTQTSLYIPADQP
jgi:hypothetical protein